LNIVFIVAYDFLQLVLHVYAYAYMA